MTTDPYPDDPRIELLARSSHSILVAPLDAHRLVEVARAERRRRRAAAGSAVVVAALVCEIFLTTGPFDSASDNSVDAANTSENSEGLVFSAPPKGMKWVGQNGVVVAVPSQWPVADSPCGTGAPGEVLNGARTALIGCLHPSPGPGDVWVTITPLSGDGSGPTPSQDFLCDVASMSSCYGGEVYPDQGIALKVAAFGADADDQVNRILDSAMVLPDGWTNVPFNASNGSTITDRIAALEEAGFAVDASAVETTINQPVEVNPAIGSPIEVGATITLTPDGRSVEESTASEEPRMPTALTCPSGQQVQTAGGFLASVPDGYDTQEQAVRAWLDDTTWVDDDSGFIVTDDGLSAWVLRADGTATARVGFIGRTSFTVHDFEACTD